MFTIICCLLLVDFRKINAQNYVTENSFEKNVCIFNNTLVSEASNCSEQRWKCDEKNNSKELELIKIPECTVTNLELNAENLNKFPNLMRIDVSSFEIQSVSLKITNSQNRHDSITSFYVSHNHLDNIPASIFAYLPNLKDIDFSHNHFESFSFDKIPKLMQINGSHNKISKLEPELFSSLVHLEYVDFSFNQIESIPANFFENNSKMRFLNLQNNVQLKSFDFSVFSRSVTSIDVQLPSKNIESLDISCRSANCLFNDVENEALFGNLRQLHAAGNHFENVTNLLDKLCNCIETVDLSGSFVGTISSSMFRRFYHLEHLHLSQSNISHIQADAFRYQTLLITLDLSYNHLNDVDSIMAHQNQPHLKRLNLEGNSLTKIDNVTPEHWPELTLIAISKNRFSCGYLRKFSEQWTKYKKVQLIRNPTAHQTNIDGIDCHTEFEHERDSQCEVCETPWLFIVGISFGTFLICAIAFGAIYWYIIRGRSTKYTVRPPTQLDLSNKDDYEMSDCVYDKSGQVYMNRQQFQAPPSNAPQRPPTTSANSDYEYSDVIYENTYSNA